MSEPWEPGDLVRLDLPSGEVLAGEVTAASPGLVWVRWLSWSNHYGRCGPWRGTQPVLYAATSVYRPDPPRPAGVDPCR